MNIDFLQAIIYSSLLAISIVPFYNNQGIGDERRKASFSIKIPKIIAFLLFLFPYKKYVPVCMIIMQSLNILSLIAWILFQHYEYVANQKIACSIVASYALLMLAGLAIDNATA